MTVINNERYVYNTQTPQPSITVGPVHAKTGICEQRRHRWACASGQSDQVLPQLAFYVNLHRAVIGPSATLTGRWRPDIDLRRMLTGSLSANTCMSGWYFARAWDEFEAVHFAHARRHIFAWRRPVDDCPNERLYININHLWYTDMDKEAYPVSILRKSISGRHRPVRVADGPMTARCRFT